MPHCAVCFKETFLSKLTTIGDQTVCCISCVGLLNTNEKDKCDYCYRPVWKDSYYKIKNKYYCSEVCKNEKIKKLNIPKESKLIQYFHVDIFNNNNCKYNLKKSRQLRMEVLKFYKDFEFDTIINNDKDKYDNNKLSFINNEKTICVEKDHYSDSVNINKYFLKLNRDDINKRKNSILRITTKDDEIFNEIKKKPYFTRPISNDFSNNHLKKAFTYTNINNKEEEKKMIKNRVKRINIQKIALHKNNYYSNIQNKRYVEGLNYSDYNLQNTFNKYNKLNQFNQSQKFNTLNLEAKNSPSISSYNFIKSNGINKSTNFKNINFFNINKVRNIPIKIGNKKSYCLYCGNNLGHATFFDRRGNAFCSDICKENFLKNKS